MEDPQKSGGQNLSRAVSRSANHHVEHIRRSDSISIPMNSICPCENDAILMGHSDSLANERGNVVGKNGADNCELDSHIQQSQGASRSIMLDKLSSVNGGKRNDWLEDNSAVRNDHLMRSRQLGMCYNSYGTTCDHTAKQENNSKFLHLISPQDLSCIDIQLASSSTTQAIITFRSMTDVVYFLHILLQISSYP